MEQNMPIQQQVGVSIPLNQSLEKPLQIKRVEEKTKFSFLDILVILSAFLVVGFLVYLVFNPNKEGSENRNSRRQADISMILSSVQSYTKDNKEIPKEILISMDCLSVGNEICRIGPYDCTGLVNLNVVTKDKNDKERVLSLPSDPENRSINGTGYYISQDGLGNVTVCAPYAERNVEISFTKYMF